MPLRKIDPPGSYHNPQAKGLYSFLPGSLFLKIFPPAENGGGNYEKAEKSIFKFLSASNDMLTTDLKINCSKGPLEAKL